VYVFFGRLRKLTRERSQALAEVQGFLHERVQNGKINSAAKVNFTSKKNIMDSAIIIVIQSNQIFINLRFLWKIKKIDA
jgi:hypothetical protein